MDFKKLKKILEKEPTFRFKQVLRLIFHDLIDDWNNASNLPISLRRVLGDSFNLEIAGEIFVSENKNTIKALITLKDDLKVETVLMRHKDRSTVCVSSQVGCPLGCSFCATGQMGYRRNLEAGEIVDQILFFARFLKKENQKINNIVFMGMGEPFLNYENVIKAIDVLNDKDFFNIGARRISISTAGIPRGINSLAKEKLQINLAISLHAPNDTLRTSIMPINKKYPIKKILNAVDNYIEKTNRKVMFEYIMIKGVNDSEENARELITLMKKHLYLVNLVPYNSTGQFKSSPKNQMELFKKILEEGGIRVTLRKSFGQDIEAACGQLTLEKNNR